MAKTELNALLNLIEDPDEEVFDSITKRFMGLGQKIIPILEEHLLSTIDEEQVKKINVIIDRVTLSVLSEELREWKKSGDPSIFRASMIISNYLNREIDQETFIYEIEQINRSVWLEVNDYLTPLEEINIINKIIFEYYEFKGLETTYSSLNDFDLSGLIFKKQSNTFPLGALYLILGALLGFNLKPVEIPHQNLLCYYEEESSFVENNNGILFFIDPLNGQVYTHKDIEQYLKKIKNLEYPLHIKTISSTQYVQKWLKELAKVEKASNRLLIQAEIQSIIEQLGGI